MKIYVQDADIFDKIQVLHVEIVVIMPDFVQTSRVFCSNIWLYNKSGIVTTISTC